LIAKLHSRYINELESAVNVGVGNFGSSVSESENFGR